MKLDNIIEAVGNKTIRCLFVHIDLKEQFMSSLQMLKKNRHSVSLKTITLVYWAELK